MGPGQSRTKPAEVAENRTESKPPALTTSTARVPQARVWERDTKHSHPSLNARRSGNRALALAGSGPGVQAAQVRGLKQATSVFRISVFSSGKWDAHLGDCCEKLIVVMHLKHRAHSRCLVGVGPLQHPPPHHPAPHPPAPVITEPCPKTPSLCPWPSPETQARRALDFSERAWGRVRGAL